MDSPDHNIPNPLTTSSPLPPPLSKSLPPIKSVKEARYVQRFSQANFSIPPPVFTSPRILQQRDKSLFKREEEMDAAGSDQLKNYGNNDGSETHDDSDSSVPEGLTNMGSLVPHHVEPSGISRFWQEGSHGQAVTVMSSFSLNQSFRTAQNYGNHDVSASIPSGLGLPSSSIRSSESMGSVSSARKMLAGNVNAQEENRMLNRNPSSEKDLESISISSIAREVHPNAQEGKQKLERNPSSEKDLERISISSVAREMYHNVGDDQQEDETAALMLVPYEGRKLTSQNSDMVEELYQDSPKRNRKRAKHINESDRCKLCDCKRSQCLKLGKYQEKITCEFSECCLPHNFWHDSTFPILADSSLLFDYCECFAAGVYCLDSCACENCFNRPEYEDTVQDTREKIEARNPLAFAPKVVKNVMNSPENMLEADQHRRGIWRHLQFEVAMDCKHAGRETDDDSNSSLAEGLTNIGSLVPHHVEPSGISRFWQEGSHGQSVTVMSSFSLNQSFRSSQNYGNHDVSASIPSGLGLPASSIRSSESMGSVWSARKMLAGSVNAQEENPMLNRNPSSEKDLESISISSIAREMHPNAQEGKQKLYRNPSSEKDLESISISSVAGEMCPNVDDDQQENESAAFMVVPYEGRKVTSQNSDMVEELCQESPKRNRKSAKHINESDGCKRCNCKRSQCLKLYCECFAAGVYCLDSCACENCFNRPEYEDAVQDTREKIEARNPLVFAPKVVKNAINSPANILEADQHQRGIRRHLQFEVAMDCKLAGSETHDDLDSSLAEGLTNFGSLMPRHVEPSGISRFWHEGSHDQAVTVMSSFSLNQSFRLAQNYGNHDVSASVPSGLGLPSSSIRSSESLGSVLSARKMLAGNVNAQEENQMFNRNPSSERDWESISISSIAREVHPNAQEGKQKHDRNPSSEKDLEIISISSVAKEMYPNVGDDQQENETAALMVVPYEGRKLTSQNSDMVEELYQDSPKRNRKRSKHINESDDCKRCNCKRSQCLKLYCECFAAGVYCLDSCACENCFNRPEYEDTVQDTREKIEAHNPLAFAPKVVKNAMNSPANMLESDQHQRGIQRHLQFDVAMDCKHTGSETLDDLNSSLPEGLTNIGSLVPHHVEPSGILRFWQEGSHGQAVTVMPSFSLNQSFRSSQNYENHDVSASIPCGLGLPTSSIWSAESMGSVSSARKMLAGNVNAQEENQMLNRNPSSEKDWESISISSIAREMHPNAQERKQKLYRNPSSEKDLESISLSSVAREMYPNVDDDQQGNEIAAFMVVPYEGRKVTSQNSDMVEELCQDSPKRNRKSAKQINESDCCKRCNCKRSQCLKLYCECFAAGVYCLDICACENCFNRPEYEDTVQDTREKIEARNPLAFAPKVVKNAMNSLANMLEEGNWTTPSSARHKRGCNCKKSKCLKKYCECYQAGVGCSSGCRCEGCNNSFGKKAEPIYKRAEKWETPSSEKLDMLGTRDDFLKSGRAHHFSLTLEELADLAHLTPLSPYYSGVATSATLYIGDSSKVSQAQAHQESNLHSSAGYLHYHHTLSNPTPKEYGSKALPELSSDNLLYDIFKEDDTPDMLKKTFTPTKAVKVSSPNQERISPQIQSQELTSSPLQGLRSGRKFILPAVPPFPPLTPHSKSNDEIQQVDDDNSTSSQ